MIINEPNRNWLLDILHLTRSTTMRRTLYTVGILGIVSALFNFITDRFLDVHSAFSPSILSLLGVVLSIMLVFRTNTAYDRWWEGRKLWGALINNTRNLAMLAQASLPVDDRKTRKLLAVRIANFCLALCDHLRDGVKTEKLISLSETERKNYQQKEHLPSYISLQIYRLLRENQQKGNLTEADLINLKHQSEALIDICGGCERIRKTPIPFSYSVYIKLFVSLYVLLLPVGLVGEFGYFSIPVSMFIAFAMIGLELMAEEIEEPFGTDSNDLPLEAMADTIRSNVFEIFELDHRVAIEEQELYEQVI
jgi:putative membrane protein